MKDHTEALKVSFDPRITSYAEMLDKFFSEHQPGRPSKGCSPQYINACWYKNAEQKAAIDKKVAAVTAKGVKVNTRIAPLGSFYKAEEYHQQYYAKNQSRW